MTVSGEWKHDEPVDCNEPFACGVPNEPLEKWLNEMENKYGVY
jgi:hypothetical protein